MKKTPTIKFVWRKFILSALLTAPLATLPSPLWALPATPDTSAANLTSSSTATAFTGTSTYLNINTPDRTVLTWGAFGIPSGTTVNYDVPTATSAVLNIVSGAGTTIIAGGLTSIGNVYILNKNGITVDTATASISVANLGLSTADEAPFNFQTTGTLSYPNTATVPVNIIGNSTGTITATSNGTVTIVGKGVNLAGTIVAGALNVNSQAGNVLLGDLGTGNVFTLGSSGSKTGNLTVITGGGNIDVANGAGAVTIYGGTANLTTSNGNVLQSAGGAFKIGKTNANGNLTINAGTGTVTLAKVDPNAATGTALNTTITAAGATSITEDIGDITLNASAIAGSLTVVSTAGVIGSGGNVSVTGGGTISLTAAVGNNITYSGTGNLTFAKISATTAAAFTNTISLTAVSGSIVLPTATDSTAAAQTYGTLSVKASGNITNTATKSIDATGTVTFDAGNTLALSTASALPSLIIKNAPNGATLTSTAATTTLKAGSAATGNVTLTAPSIVFGGATGDSMSFTNLTLIANAAGPATTISDLSDTVTVTGATTLTPGAGNSVILDGSTGVGTLFASNFGQVNITNGLNATVFGKTALNLGAIAITGNLVAIATAGNITDSGQIKAVNVTVGAGTAAAPGNINLDFTAAAGSGNQISGTIYLQDDIDLVLGRSVQAGTSTSIGNYLANNVTVMNENAITMSPITNTYAAGIGGNLTLTGAGVTLGNTIIGGTANLTSTASIAATGTNTISAFNINATRTAGGAQTVAVTSSGSTTVNATLSGPTGNGSSATFTSGGNLTIGTVTSNYDGAGGVVFAGSNIADSAIAGIQIYGPVAFNATNNVTVTKGGDNFGTVTLATTTDGSTLSLVESGTAKLASVNAGTKNATISITSQNGSIIEATGATIAGGTDTTKTMSLSAVNGSITLDQVTNNTFAGPTSFTVNGTAGSGNVTYLSNSSVVLGNTTVSGGTLGIDVSNTTGNSLSQATGTSAYVYGNLILKAVGTGAISLTNSGNRFGAYEIMNGTGNVSVTEDTTINLQAINTSGNLTIKSNNGYILDSTNSSLASGYANSIVASGATKTATFTANAAGGSITLALPNSAFTSTVALNTSGNASVISSAAATLNLGQSTVGGTLTVTDSANNQNITQSGPLAVTGNVSLNTTGATSGITLTNANNQFGGIRFYAAGSGGANISEATTMNLLGGSLSNGNVVLSTAGNFITTGPGGSSISGNLNISANGTIIPSAGSLLVTGTFTVYSIGTTDLSALSKSGNLFNKAPVNTGPGTYIPPSL